MGGSASVLVAERKPPTTQLLCSLSSKFSMSQSTEKGSSSRRASVHEEVYSFRAKAGALKMLIRNKLSREAFYQFLKESLPGKNQLLSCFLALEGVKKEAKRDYNIAKIKLDAMFHQHESCKGIRATEIKVIESQIFLITRNLKDIESLDTETVCRKICQAQDELLLLMTPSYEAFLDSSNYEAFEILMKKNERKVYGDKSASQSQQVSLNADSTDRDKLVSSDSISTPFQLAISDRSPFLHRNGSFDYLQSQPEQFCN